MYYGEDEKKCLKCGKPVDPTNSYCGSCFMKLGFNLPADATYASYECQRCGANIGWIGRFFDWVFGDNHNCASRLREKNIP